MPHELQAIFDDIGRTVTFLRGTTTEGDDLGATVAYTIASRGTLTTSATGVIQPANSRELIEASQRGLEITHKVYYLSDPAVDEQDRMQFTDGAGTVRTLQVKGQVNFDEADEVWKVFALEQTEELR